MYPSILTMDAKIVELGSIYTADSKNGLIAKQDFVVQTTDKYPSKMAFTAVGEKVDELSYYSLDSEITVKFKCWVSEFKGKNYNNLKVIGFGKEQK